MIRKTLICLLVLSFALLFSCGHGGGGKSGFDGSPGVTGSSPDVLNNARSELREYTPPTDVDSQLFQKLSDKFLEELTKAQSRGTSQGTATPTWDMELTATDNLDGSYTFTWNYFNQGDYDLNGEVGIPDITPIAQNYLAITNDGDNDRVESYIDGDGSTEIGIPDITPIPLSQPVFRRL